MYKNRARNILVTVELRDKNNKWIKNLQSYYVNCPRCVSHYTSVRYHNRSPLLFDQIKVELPENLDENHHLYFTVYQVSVSG